MAENWNQLPDILGATIGPQVSLLLPSTPRFFLEGMGIGIRGLGLRWLCTAALDCWSVLYSCLPLHTATCTLLHTGAHRGRRMYDTVPWCGCMAQAMDKINYLILLAMMKQGVVLLFPARLLQVCNKVQRDVAA